MNKAKTHTTSRFLPHSPAQIYKAFASAEILTSWWGPNGFSNTFEVFEFNEGGKWEFLMHGPDGRSYKNNSVFLKLIPDSKIVIHHDCPPNFTLTIELTPEGNGTLLTWNQEFDDAKTAQAIKERAGSGNEENLDRLEQALQLASVAV